MLHPYMLLHVRHLCTLHIRCVATLHKKEEKTQILVAKRYTLAISGAS